MCVEYRKGPIGYAVVHNGKSVGVIKRIPSAGYLVAINGFRPGDGTSKHFSVGASGFAKGDGAHVFPTIKAAKAKVHSVLSAEPCLAPSP